MTVNNQLALDKWGHPIAATTLNNDMWAALIEKAYVAFNTQTGTVNCSGGHANSYDTLSGGMDNGVAAITRQSMQIRSANEGMSASSATEIFNAVVAAFRAGQDVLFSTDANSSKAGNWVNDHMFAVTGVDASAGALTLSNPCGTGGAMGAQEHDVHPDDVATANRARQTLVRHRAARHCVKPDHGHDAGNSTPRPVRMLSSAASAMRNDSTASCTCARRSRSLRMASRNIRCSRSQSS